MGLSTPKRSNTPNRRYRTLSEVVGSRSLPRGMGAAPKISYGFVNHIRRKNRGVTKGVRMVSYSVSKSVMPALTGSTATGVHVASLVEVS